MNLLFATTNPNKLREARAILGALGIEVSSLETHSSEIAEPVEDGLTFEANAEIKARYYARELGQRCLAEDSGLEVDALGGAPGVYSARYAGSSGSREERDRANNEKLLRVAAGVADGLRQARFICALCVADPDGRIVARARGTFEGLLGREPRGAGGFGYDPLLFLPDVGCTSAELSASEKHKRSHRGLALRRLVAELSSSISE